MNILTSLGRHIYATAAALIVGCAVQVAASVVAIGGILYGTSDDNAFPFVLLPAPAVTPIGWAILLKVFTRSRAQPTSSYGAAYWLLVAAVALPIAAWAATQFTFGLGGAWHHYPACAPQHLGPC